MNTLTLLFSSCNNVLNQEFNFFGFNLTLWQFIAFDIIVFLLTFWILELFRKQ